jgi:uncharacterized protein (DUF736 family)
VNEQPTEEQRERAEAELAEIGPGWQRHTRPGQTFSAVRLATPHETQASATLTGLVKAVKSAEERIAALSPGKPTVITGVQSSGTT